MDRRAWRLVRIVALGLTLTSAVATLDHAGALLSLEQWTYDQRVRHFQHAFAKPDDGLVHVLIDDASLERDKIGKWPWPRARLAELLDEAVRAGAEQVAFDIVLSDPSDRDAASDARLAESLARAAAAGVKVMLPVTVNLDAPADDDGPLARVAATLQKRLDQSPAEVAAGAGVDETMVRTRYYDPALELAMARVARIAVREAGLADDAAVVRWMPGLTREGVALRTPESEAFRQKLRLARTVTALESRTTMAVAGVRDLRATSITGAPIDAFARQIASTGFVDYLRPADGRVRNVPLAVNADGRLLPHFGLALAAMRLGVDLTDARQVEASPDFVVLRPPGRPAIRVPVRTALVGDPPRPVGALMDIPLRGGRQYTSMYAPRDDAFVTVMQLWRPIDVERRIRSGAARMAKVVELELPTIDPNDPAADDPPKPDDAKAVADAARRTLAAYDARPHNDVTPRGTEQRLRMRVLAESLAALPRLQSELDEYRQALRRKLGGRAMLVGWASSSMVADLVPTSIHADCPGVAIHGAIVNAILTGELWTHLPPGYATALTLVCGVLTTLAVSQLTPPRALLASLGLLMLVTGGASVGLFDYGNIVIGLAGPITAIVVCWAACTLVITLRERLDRAQVTRRFRSYVDPALVSYVLENPERASLAGESREMTVVFIDVEGFTALTEKMGEQSIAILRRLMDDLVPIIRRHNGFVNKFLGDGVMFFYGAPRHDPDHARHAVATVLEMQQALGAFNARQAEGVPKLGVRAGISTGRMLVGDAGSADASDYTVLGDAVNLASRLEGANKPLGTAALATARTAELCGDQFLFAPLGRLIVVGKENAVPVVEPVCDLSHATEEQKACAEALAKVWSHVDGRQVLEAVAAVDSVRAFGGRVKLCKLLDTLLNELQTTPTDRVVSIRLSEK